MPTEDESWFEARERARQRRQRRDERREARAPRTAAVREALDAVRWMKGQDPDDIRTALIRELSERGVTDATPGELNFLVQTVDSPRRAALGLVFRHVKALGAAVAALREIARTSAPSWTDTPDGIPSLISFRDDQEEVEVALRARDLHEGRDTLIRLFAELPHHDPERDGRDELRPFCCWLSHEKVSGSPQPVKIHIGEHAIGDLPSEHADLARRLIAEHGKDKHAIDVIAEAFEQDIETGRLTLFLPDRP